VALRLEQEEEDRAAGAALAERDCGRRGTELAPQRPSGSRGGAVDAAAAEPKEGGGAAGAAAPEREEGAELPASPRPSRTRGAVLPAAPWPCGRRGRCCRGLLGSKKG